MLYFLILFLTVIALYLILIKPKNIDSSSFNPLMGRYYAHRGLFNNKGACPENSLMAFALAVKNDYGIELDVQLTKDQIPIVFHDYDLKRVCKVDRQVCDYNYDELKSLNLYESEQIISTLEEVLDLVEGKVPLIIELKGESIDDSLCKIISPLLDSYKGFYVIESFNPFLLRWYKKNRPNIIRGQLSSKMDSTNKSILGKLQDLVLENLLLNFMGKPHFIAFNHKDKDMVSFNLVKKLYKPLTIAFTIQSQEDLDTSKDHFDLFIFDSFIPK